MSKLSDKAGRINFDDLDGQTQPSAAAVAVQPSAPPTGEAPQERPRTGVGAFSASLAFGRQLEQENDELKRKVAEFEDAKLVVMLDPNVIKPTRYANRLAESFKSKEFEALKQEIALAGRNIQWIKVRHGAVEEGVQTYEIVFGHRRHRACLELGIPVAAVVEDMDDASLFAQMDQENRGRKDLSPLEQGLMYANALETGLYASQRQMAEKLGVAQSAISQAIVLAELPREVVDAFPDRLEIQYRWGAALKLRLKSHGEDVLASAREIKAGGGGLSAKEVLSRLLGVSKTTLPAPRQIMAKGKAVGTFGRAKNGDLEVRLKKGVLTPSVEQKLSDFLDKLLG
jgi:ParB family chromosome partitioning protein